MIQEYSSFFIKRSFDLPEYRKKKIKLKPVYKDDMFYSFFFQINNLDITSTNFETYNEKQEKTILAEKLDKLKFKHKDFIMNNLMYDQNIHLMTLNILCKFYNITINFIKGQIVFPMCHGDTCNGDTCNGDTILCMNDKYQFIPHNQNIIDTLYIVSDLDKPLYAISHYKLVDLVDISKQLKLPYDLKKQKLYDSIYSTLVNLNIYKID